MNLTLRELKASKTFLSQAHILVAAVRALFFGAGDGITAARLNDLPPWANALNRCRDNRCADGARC